MAGVIVYQFWNTPRVEAAELLEKAVATAKSRAARPTRVRIRAGRVQMTRVINPKQPIVETAQLAPIEALFSASHYEWNDPLNPASYLAWHQQLPEKSAGVEHADSAYTIRTTTDSGDLVEATLKLREQDLHAVEGTFRFRNDERVEITELLGEAAPELTAEARRTPPDVVSQSAPAAKEAPQPAAELLVEATAADELRVIAALHRIGADLGDPLEVVRFPRQVVVTGVGIEPSRRIEIERILESMPRVATQFDEPAGGAPLPLRNTVRAAASEPLVRLQSQLEKHVGGRPSFERFSDHLLQSADTMLAHAHALRRLAERFPSQVEASLGPEDHPVLDMLRRDHMSTIRREVNGIEASLGPALRSIGGSSQIANPSTGFANWQANSERLLSAARELEKLMAAVLGGATLEESSLQHDMPSGLLAAIERVRSECIRAESMR
jgi:hypothetical protein